MEEGRLISKGETGRRESPRAVLTIFLGVAASLWPALSSGGSADPRPLLKAGDVQEIRKAIDERRGSPLLVNFWAVWCDPCVEELPDLAKIETRFASSGIHVLGVSGDLLLEDDSPAVRKKITDVLRNSKVTYPNLLFNGSSESLVDAFALPGPIPHSILYSAEGREVRRWTGRLALTELGRTLQSLPKARAK